MKDTSFKTEASEIIDDFARAYGRAYIRESKSEFKTDALTKEVKKEINTEKIKFYSGEKVGLDGETHLINNNLVITWIKSKAVNTFIVVLTLEGFQFTAVGDSVTEAWLKVISSANINYCINSLVANRG